MAADRYNAFFDFMKEREQIRLRKGADLPYPWTEDEILRKYKFTNIRRHHDRTSRELRDMYYEDHFEDDKKTILMNCALFRYFGTYEFARVVGWQPYEEFNFEQIKLLAENRLENKKRVFTGAYVITNQGISAPKSEVVVDYFLKDLYEAAETIVEISEETCNWEMVAAEMRTVKGFGGSGFMTKEILLDTTYTGFWGEATYRTDPDEGNFSFPADWDTWTPIGPGARRGAARVRGDENAKPLSESESGFVIDHLGYNQELYWPEENGWLAPHDIQFQLCEFDKYERVRLGQGRPRSKYKVRD